MASDRAMDRALAWGEARTDGTALRRFRLIFGVVWLAYDALDLALGGTFRTVAGLDVLRASPPGWFVALQVCLVLCDMATVLGSRTAVALVVAALLRSLELTYVLPLNDWAYFTVTAALLAFARPDGWPVGRPVRDAPRWVLDLLRWELAWIYFATALLKSNSAWLSGGILFARAQFLATAVDWPYPDLALAGIGSRTFLSVLASSAVVAELTLAGLILYGRRGRWATALAVSIHGFAALFFDVWFFGAAMIAHVALLGAASNASKRNPP